MSLELKQDSSIGVEIGSDFYEQANLYIREIVGGRYKANIRIGPKDMCELIRYWFQNTDLNEDDPRLGLIRDIGGAVKTEGHTPGRERLDIPRGA